MSITKKKKHVSKKNKKDWRKHCDIRDVEDFLEDQRLEERLGKFETKADSELFVVDTGAEETRPEITEKPLTAKQRKRAKLSETPKCFEVLLPSSKVPDPNAKRNHVNLIGTKATALSKITEGRREKKGAYEKKLELARKNRKIALEKKRKVKQIRQNFNLDLWGNELPEAKGIPETLCEEFMSPEAQLHNVLPERLLRPKPPVAKTVATRAAVETPHPGVSYNPAYKEHQELLQEVVQHESKMMKREEHILRVTSGMFSKVTMQQKQDQWRSEMSAGLPKNKNKEKTEEKSDSETDNEYKAINPPVKNKKKDHKARRKQKERLVEKERLKQEKINKKKISDIYKLRKLQSTILTKEQQQAKEREERSNKRAVKEATALPALSAHKTPKLEPDLVEPSALTGDLRHIGTSTNLLKDRYESLQRRGKLAASKLMMKKKRKLKGYFKPGHKVTDQEIEKYVNKTSAKEVKGIA